MGGEFGGEWIHIYVWLSPSGVHPKLSQHEIKIFFKKKTLSCSCRRTGSVPARGNKILHAAQHSRKKTKTETLLKITIGKYVSSVKIIFLLRPLACFIVPYVPFTPYSTSPQITQGHGPRDNSTCCYQSFSSMYSWYDIERLSDEDTPEIPRLKRQY